MVHSVKFLGPKHEDVRSAPQHPQKSQAQWHTLVIPVQSRCRQETPEVCRLAILSKSLSSWFHEKLLLKIKR